MIRLTDTENLLMSFCKGVLKFPGINSESDEAIRALYKHIYGGDNSTIVTAYAYASLANAFHRILLKTHQGEYTLSDVIFNTLKHEYKYHQLLCDGNFYQAVFSCLKEKLNMAKVYDKNSAQIIAYTPVRELPVAKAA